MGLELEAVWDGRFYKNTDMARLACKDCAGCSSCCEGMGDTVTVDPFDLLVLAAGLKKQPSQLLQEGLLSLHVNAGVIVPHLVMQGEKAQCVFLTEEGRCGIHRIRPGFCRLFPLGRFYEENGFRYFLQKDGCQIKNRSKERIDRWLQIPNLPRYEQYVNRWHQFLLSVQIMCAESEDETKQKALSVALLQEVLLANVPVTLRGNSLAEILAGPQEEQIYALLYARMEQFQRKYMVILES